METANQLESWRDLYVMLGTSTAALLGLLLVVASLHLDDITRNPAFRIRSRNNTYYLLGMLVEAILILTPQPIAILGAELAAIKFCAFVIHLINIHKFTFVRKEMANRGGFSIYRGVAFLTSDLIGLAGGIFLFMLSIWGMYLITASFSLLFVIIAVNAWSILLGVAQAEKNAEAD